MTAGIFVLNEVTKPVPLQRAEFINEADFQKMIADAPELLAGDQIDPERPRKWLLIKREMQIACEEDGVGTWSTDHVFLDQEGIPTLIEVKRQNNTDLRRKVIGQMLDYAANFAVNWSADTLRQTLAASFEDHEARVTELTGNDSPDDFWRQVKDNLDAGRIRLVFVADRIPQSLRRIVEFLNTQMNPAEVLAVELRHYKGSDMRAIVPIVYGQTEQARTKKSVSGPEDSNFEGKDDYDRIMERCSKDGDKIEVGFMGDFGNGEQGLRDTPIADLKKRKSGYKWAWRGVTPGNRTAANWVAGDRFFQICQKKEQDLVRPL